jgi:L-ascorbate metabolism protein UlaG (beta-lactamase superfamily)
MEKVKSWFDKGTEATESINLQALRHAEPWNASNTKGKSGMTVQLLNEYTGLLVRTHNTTLLFDPAYITLPIRSIPVPDALLISNSASDHFEPKTVHALAGENTNIIGTAKAIDALKKTRWRFEEDNLVALSPGGEMEVGNVIISAKKALHPMEYMPGGAQAFAVLAEAAKGTMGEIPLTFLLKTKDMTFYHAMDSLSTSEMIEIGNRSPPKAAFVPLRMDRWNSAAKAVELVSHLKPNVVMAHRYSKLRGFVERRETKKECEAFEKEMLRRGVKTVFLEKGAGYALEGG